MANTYFQMLQAVENYYGAGSDQWLTMANWTGYQSTEVANILQQVPGITTYTNEAGELLSYSLEASPSYYTAAQAAAAEAAGAINSNAVAAETAVQNLAIPANVVEGATAGTVEISSGATAVATGTKVGTVLGHVGTGIVGAAVGMKLGVWIDGALYNANPEFWDSHNLSEMNPETWGQTKVTNWLYDYSGYDDFIAHFDEDGQMYVDENVLALYAQYLANRGAFNDQAPFCTRSEEQPWNTFNFPEYVGRHWTYYKNNAAFTWGGTPTQYTAYNNDENVYIFLASTDEAGAHNFTAFAFSLAPFDITGVWGTSPSGYVILPTGETVYIKWSYNSAYYNTLAGVWNYAPESEMGYDQDFWFHDIPMLVYHGINGVGGVEGINQYDDVPVGITPEMTTPQIINLLKQQYPELWDNAIKQGSLNDDGTITDRVYVPVAVPTGGTAKQPTSDPEHPGAVDPENEPQTKYITNIVNPTPNPTEDPNPPEKGSGSTPTAPMPTGSASALYKIYNPTEAQIQSFGAWLWSSNFVDQLLKIFNDPMQAIISLHKIYATPHIGGTSNIKVGYLDSGVASKWVDQQYIDVDCGSVKLLEKNGNVFDYAPFVDVRIYLPFVGIVSLAVADVMRSTINVKYRIDVITGTCIAIVSVNRDGGAGGVIYQYTGSMAENYPLSSGSYMGIITGMLGLAAGVAGTIATGGAAAPALLGGAAGLTAMHTKVEHSNGFSGNAGALACKKPYLIISRQQSAMANGVDANIGMPTNSLVTLSQCSGFTKVKAIHLHGIRNATDAEQDEIIRLLTEGVII